ncbi:MAG: C1 family peptidase [Phycisphaeraceae bacterium]|nr:C1 family peptidase [Phycisphaerales bacterium]MCB9860574.1 C1 family peptidase [Phycisphaeraceae bacterium]
MKTAWIALVTLALCTSSTFSQTGSIDPTREELDTLTKFVPSEIELIEQPSVDLRRWMPPVGEQLMNDCTAWAMAYGAKTYAEARDQNWKPDAPSRIFSPRFVYNQINKGVDEGSNFIQATILMADKGAATLATEPYRPGDYSSQPSERAKAEAKAFPVYDAMLVDSRIGIRRALQRREVVVFGAHVGPAFLSGRFEEYTPTLFTADSKNRKPGQPHGKHAMVIVGYDDQRGCFLVQNSWGTDWAWHGYAWVAYELFDDIRIEADGMVFCNWACTLLDVEEPVTIGTDGVPKPAPKDLKTLHVKGHSDIVRYDPDLEKYVYIFTAQVQGQREALTDIEKVEWAWTNEFNKAESYTSDISEMRFAIIAGTVLNPLKIDATLHMKDGTRRKISGELVGPNPKADFRDATIYFHDDYFGNLVNNKATWEWEAKLDYPLEQRMDIVKVVWNVGNMNWRDPVQVNDGFNGPPAEEHAFGFANVPNEVSAEIHYNDGGIKVVKGHPGKFKDPIEDFFHIDVEKHLAGVHTSGEPLYAVRLSLDYPKQRQFDVKRVLYEVDAHIAPDALLGYQTFDNYQVFLETHRDFRLHATVEFENGTTQTFNEWVTLADDTKYSNPLRMELAVTDWYQGNNGGASYAIRYEIIGDRETVDGIKEVRYRELNHPEWSPVVVPADGTGRFVRSTTWSESFVDLAATVVFTDGAELELKKQHTRTSAVNDVLGFKLAVEKRDKLKILQDPHLLYEYTISLEGPYYRSRQIHSVDWYHTVGERREKTVHPVNWVMWPEAFQFNSSFDKPFELTAVLHDYLGFQEYITVPVSAMSVGDRRPAMRLSVREKFYAYDDKKEPQWDVRLELQQDYARMPSKPTKVEYLFTSLVSGAKTQAFERDPGTWTHFYLKEPQLVTAEVTFENGTTQTISNVAHTNAPRSDSPVRIDAFRQLATGDTRRYMIIVDGWENSRKAVRHIVMDAPGEDQDKDYSYSEGAVPDPMHFTYTAPDATPHDIKITVTFASGNSYDYIVKLPNEKTTLTVDVEQRYWGDGQWEATLTPTADWWPYLAQRTYWKGGFGYYFFDNVHAWPPGSVRIRTQPGNLKVQPYPTRDGDAVENSVVLIGPKQGEDDWKSHVTESLVMRKDRPTATSGSKSPNEWVAYIDGPEKDMIRIDHVTYTWREGESTRQFSVSDRWGEFRRGYEARVVTDPEMPTVKAVVTFKDGSTTTFGSLDPK